MRRTSGRRVARRPRNSWLVSVGVVLLVGGGLLVVRQATAEPGSARPVLRVAEDVGSTDGPTSSPSVIPSAPARPTTLEISEPRAADHGTFAPGERRSDVPRARRARVAHPERAPFPPGAVRFGNGAEAPRALVDRVSTLDDGSLELPEDPSRMGWWSGGSLAGAPYGSVVLAGHLDSRLYGLGFASLMEGLGDGDEVTLSDATRERRYRVERTYLLPRTRLADLAALFAGNGPARLVMITCGGSYDRARGAYSDNLVVEAVPVG
jgi:Sortase domain